MWAGGGGTIMCGCKFECQVSAADIVELFHEAQVRVWLWLWGGRRKIEVARVWLHSCTDRCECRCGCECER